MIVLLAAGVGISVMGLIAIGFGIPISDTSFGNALLIAGVVIMCTGLILTGMWFAVRELTSVALAQAGRDRQPARPAPQRPAAVPPPFPAPAAVADASHDGSSEPAAASSSPPPWAGEVAARTRARPTAPPAAPDIVPAEPEAPPPPAVPDRPARRNLLFASRRRDAEAAPVLPTALESQPKVSFENAWPSLRPNGSQEVVEPTAAPAEAAPKDADASSAGAAQTAEAPNPPRGDLPPGVTVVRSGTVDEMAYTYYSDGSIEAQLAGESPIRFASLDELRTYVEQRK